jgi:hypothetical protein
MEVVVMAAPIGAKVTAGGQSINKNQNRKISFGAVEWDSGNFFRASQPNRLRVPVIQAGRYIVQLAIRWYRPPNPTGPPVDPTSSYFYAAVLVNDQTHGGDARSTVPRVSHATGTTQLIVHETDLAGGDRIQALLWHGFDETLWADVYFQLRRVDV